MSIEFPITVKALQFLPDQMVMAPVLADIGDIVWVKPADPTYEGESWLGMVIGDVGCSMSAGYNEENQFLFMQKSEYQLAIFAPEAKLMVFAFECIWEKITKTSQLVNFGESSFYGVALDQIARLNNPEQIEDKAEKPVS